MNEHKELFNFLLTKCNVHQNNNQTIISYKQKTVTLEFKNNMYYIKDGIIFIDVDNSIDAVANIKRRCLDTES